MPKRRFDTKRLYGLIRLIVIIVTVISGLIAVPNYINLEITNETLKGWQETCDTDFNMGYESWLTCVKAQNSQLDAMQNAMERTALLTIVLPTLFFGGTWLFNYLFPKKHAKKKT